MRTALNIVRSLLDEAEPGHSSSYHEGYMDALRAVEEMIAEAMWAAGEDEDG